MTDLPEFSEEDIEKTEVIEHPEATTEHSAGRRVALQVLYEVDSTHHPFTEALNFRLEEAHLTKKAERYVRRLVKGVLDNMDKLDMLIQRHATEWPLGQVAIVDRNILRLAVYQLAAQPYLSVSVVIAEALELADLFGAEGTIPFVNGVLGALAASERQAIGQILPSETESGD